MQQTPKVYVVLVNWNAWGHTLECLESIYHSDYPNFQVIVVDNASSDDSVSKIESWARGELLVQTDVPDEMKPYSSPPVSKPIRTAALTLQESQSVEQITGEDSTFLRLSATGPYPLVLIQSGANLGFGAGNNVAMSFISKRGDADQIWLLNNDTVIEPTTLSAMVATAKSAPGIIGSVVRYYSQPIKVQAYGGGHFSSLTGSARLISKPARKSVNFIFGASFMLDRSTLDQIGLFDENIFMYFEEVEYCIRAKERGILMSFSHANVYHKVRASSGDQYFQWKSIYKNRVYTMRKHFGRGWWILFMALNWLTNVLSPFVHPDKRKASREALGELLKGKR
ncbi:MAG: glycosyl transferase family 2 [Acidobacteriales bacterium]|nr:glycosyl transferase family 2 [Terriglobales bacterium]